MSLFYFSLPYLRTRLAVLLAALTAMSLLTTSSALAQVPNWQQLIYDRYQPRSVGSSSIEATATDASGNIIVAGVFSYDISFGTTMLTCTRANDLFIAKWSPASSTWLWAVRDGGYDIKSISGLVVSGTSIYIAGDFACNPDNTIAGVSLPGAGLPGASYTDVFVAKYTDTGSTATGVWAASGGSVGNDTSTGLAVSGTAVYTTGTFRGSASIAGASLSAAGFEDVFVAKYVDQGSTVANGWARRSGGTGTEFSGGLAVSGSNVYITGSFDGRATVAGVSLPGTYRTDGLPTRDLFLAKYDDAGTGVWAVQVGGQGSEYGRALAVSGSDIYLGADFSSTTASFGGIVLTSVSGQDVALAKYTDTGSTATAVWAVSQGGGGTDQVRALALQGNALYAIGTFTTTSWAPTTFVNTTMTSAGLADVFLARYDAGTGAGQWVRQAGGSSDDVAYDVVTTPTDLLVNLSNLGQAVAYGPNQSLWAATDVGVLGWLDPGTGSWRGLTSPYKLHGSSCVYASATDADGKLFVAGRFQGQIMFGKTLLTGAYSSGSSDMFLAKWSPAANAWQWAVRGGGSDDDEATGLAVVGHEVYLAGTFTSNKSCRIAGTDLPGAGNTDVFVAGYTDNGSSVTENWAVSLGGTGADDAAGLAASASGVYVAGTYGANATAAGVVLPGAQGTNDVYLAKYTPAGANGWAVSGLSSGLDRAGGVAVNGNLVYLLAAYNSPRGATFAGTTLPHSGSLDLVLAKYIDNGTSAANGWAVRAGNAGSEQGTGIAVNGANLYITGYFGSLQGTTIAGTALTGAGNEDLFVAKYVDQGTTAANGWARSGGTASSGEYAQAIAVRDDYVYVTGYFGSTTGGVIAGSPVVSVGSNDVFLARFTDLGTSGADGWAVTGGGRLGYIGGVGGSDLAYAVAVYGTNVYTGGQVGVAVGSQATPPLYNSLPPTFGLLKMESGSGYPYFMARLNDAPAPVITALTPGSSAPGATISITGLNLTGITSITFTGPTGPLTVTTGFVGNAGGTQLTGVVVPAGALTGPVTVTGPGGTSVGFGLLLPGPQLAVTQGSTPYPSGGLVYTFGPQPVGTTSAPVVFTLSNPGTAPLTLTNLVLSADFVLSGPMPTTVPAGGTTSVGVAYAPTRSGAWPGSLILTSVLGTYIVNLAGQGLPNPTAISYSPAVAPVGTTVTITGTNFVQNGTTVTLNGVVLSGVVVGIGGGTLTFVVPPGAISGPMTLSTSGGTVNAGALCVPYTPAAAAVSGCAGTPLTLTASGAPGTAGYLWYASATGTTVLGSGASFVTPGLSSNTTYYVAVDFGAAGANCPNPRTAVPVTLTAAPRPTIAAGGPLTFCAGDSVRLTASGADTYRWSTGETTASIRVTAGGSYTVTGSSAATGCAGLSAAVAVVVQVLPATPTITPAAGGLLSSSAASGNQWYVGGVLIPGATGVSYQAPANGSYSVTTTSAAGCVSAASAPAVVVLTGTAGAALAEGFVLFPNPAHHAATVQLPAGLGAARLTLLNALGQTVRTVAVSGQAVALDLRGLAPGVYAVQLAAGGQRATRRLVVE